MTRTDLNVISNRKTRSSSSLGQTLTEVQSDVLISNGYSLIIVFIYTDGGGGVSRETSRFVSRSKSIKIRGTIMSTP